MTTTNPSHFVIHSLLANRALPARRVEVRSVGASFQVFCVSDAMFGAEWPVSVKTVSQADAVAFARSVAANGEYAMA